MISQQAVQKILGIYADVQLSSIGMAKQLKVSFYPSQNNSSESTKAFAKKLEESFIRLGVQVIPSESIWESVSMKKRLARFFKYLLNNIKWSIRKLFNLPEINFLLPLSTILQLNLERRIKKGICIVCIGEQDTDKLPMQYISNFKTNSIITILDFPKNVDKSSSFSDHFDTAMSLFAYHMTNIVISVNQSNWMVYNFNASHPIYSMDDPDFDTNVLKSIIPKVVAPISPHTFREFIVLKEKFDIKEPRHEHAVREMLEGALSFERTGLYPQGKKIDELPFRNNYHRLIGKLHLDNRSGMSFGFIAFQMPITIFPVQSLKDFGKDRTGAFYKSDYYVDRVSKDIYILIEENGAKIVAKIPEVWVMTLRSGADKTHFNLKTDLLKIGLINGKMYMQFSDETEINRDYKPSFDTKVILAHAVGNALIAELSEYFKRNQEFVKTVQMDGIAISHWHGYFNKKLTPLGLVSYGHNNPHVSCSSPQSAIYALQGKIEAFLDTMKRSANHEYLGDAHIEPHHGINVSYPSLTMLARYILEHPNTTELGNKYL